MVKESRDTYTQSSDSMDPLKFQIVKEKLPEMLPVEKGGEQLFSGSAQQESTTKNLARLNLDSTTNNDLEYATISNVTESTVYIPEARIEQTRIDPSLDKKELPISASVGYDNELKIVSSGGKNHVWGMNSLGELFHAKIGEVGLEWEKLASQQLFSDFSVAKGGYLFAIGKEDSFLYRLDPSKNHMERLLEQDLTQFKSISAVTQDSSYLITLDGNLLHFNKDKFTLMTGNLKKLSVGGPMATGILGLGTQKMELWGIDHQDHLVKYIPDSNTWFTYPLEVQDVAAGRDLSVYIINKSDLQLMKLDREKDVFIAQPVRSTTEGNLRLRNISAYKENRDVYAVDYDTGNVIKLFK
jgi:hypothetical protein